ncbi:MAG: hypothetical protein M1826_002558 [Phylliscum demangeonii]|nr:MAG: hypothetical protein M1826_002558 [Phylliscum demangeonii]
MQESLWRSCTSYSILQMALYYLVSIKLRLPATPNLDPPTLPYNSVNAIRYMLRASASALCVLGQMASSLHSPSPALTLLAVDVIRTSPQPKLGKQLAA